MMNIATIILVNRMEIETIVVGFLRENCYIVTKNGKTIIIDPGDEAQKIIDACKNKTVVGVLLTHHHFDHVGALQKIKTYFGVETDVFIDDFGYEIIETPGHTSDSNTYYFPLEKVMFTGDFIFYGTIGRMDLPSGSKEDMEHSLEKIKDYPLNIKIYPGHGAPSTLQREVPHFYEYLQE